MISNLKQKWAQIVRIGATGSAFRWLCHPHLAETKVIGILSNKAPWLNQRLVVLWEAPEQESLFPVANKIVSPIVVNYPILLCEKWYIYPNSC